MNDIRKAGGHTRRKNQGPFGARLKIAIVVRVMGFWLTFFLLATSDTTLVPDGA